MMITICSNKINNNNKKKKSTSEEHSNKMMAIQYSVAILATRKLPRRRR